MADNVRMNKILKFGVDVVRAKFNYKNFNMEHFSDSDMLNYIVTEWLEQNYTRRELSQMGYDELGVK